MSSPGHFPILRRKGLIVPSGILGEQWSKHLQMPTPFLLDEDTLRIFFCSRDKRNLSYVFWVDVEPEPPFTVKAVGSKPALSPGAIGAFDANGVMPTALMQREDELWMYFIGWSVRADVPYHNAVGVARSYDGGETFERFLPGPVLATSVYEPFFCGTAELGRVDNRWVMWYMSATEWRSIDQCMEPRYHLKQAFSDDGIHWEQKGSVAVDYANDDEGGVARATVLQHQDKFWMWFCYRGIENYRSQGKNTYQIGFASSVNGIHWQRLGPSIPVFNQPPKEGDFDQTMQCYPAVYSHNSNHYLFYNGSGFGQTGIGYANIEFDLN